MAACQVKPDACRILLFIKPSILLWSDKSSWDMAACQVKPDARRVLFFVKSSMLLFHQTSSWGTSIKVKSSILLWVKNQVETPWSKSGISQDKFVVDTQCLLILRSKLLTFTVFLEILTQWCLNSRFLQYFGDSNAWTPDFYSVLKITMPELMFFDSVLDILMPELLILTLLWIF